MLNVNVIPFVQYKNKCLILSFASKLFNLSNNTFVAYAITRSSGIDGIMLSMSNNIKKNLVYIFGFQIF